MSTRPMAMSAADAAWLHMDRRENPMVINALVQLSEPLALQGLHDRLRQRLLPVYPKFKMMVRQESLPLIGSSPLMRSLPIGAPLALGGPAWMPDPGFELSRHVHHISLPRPGNAAALRELVSDLASTPLPMEMPPWQVHLIERSGEDTALVVRMHHCMADGIALARVLLSLTDGEPGAEEPEAVTPSSAAAGAAAAEPGGQWRNLGLQTLVQPRRLLQIGYGGMRAVEVLARLILASPDPAGGLKGALSGLRRVGWCEPIEISQIKAIAGRHSATVNDVLLAAVAGALRGHLKRAGVRSPRMRAIVPFNLRGSDEPLPAQLGNRFGLVFLELPVAERGRRERLLMVKRGMDEIKRSPEGPVSYAVLQAIGAAPQLLQAGALRLFTSKGSAVVTDVPGPHSPRLLAGARLASLQVWAPTSGSIGLSVSIISYAGAITVGLMADPMLVEDPQRIAGDVAAELAAMEDLRRSAGTRRAA